MRALSAIVLGVLALGAWATTASQAGEKPLPPAFGKELVPDSQTQRREASDDDEVEEQRREDRKATRQRRGAIDGDLDSDLDDDGGGGDED